MSGSFERSPILPTAPWLVRFLRTVGAVADVFVIMAGVWTLLQTPPSLDETLGFYEATSLLWSLLLIGGGTASFVGTALDRPRPQLYGCLVAALGAALWGAANVAVGTFANYSLACVFAFVVTVLIGRAVAVPALARVLEVEGALRRDDR